MNIAERGGSEVAQQELIELIDQTAVLVSRNRADFILDAARRAAQDTLFGRSTLPKPIVNLWRASPRLSDADGAGVIVSARFSFDRLCKDQKVKMAATAMRKYLIRWCARQDSNLRPPGS